MKTCLECGTEVLIKENKFCNSSCAAKYNNKKRGPRSEETKQKITDSINNHFSRCNRSRPKVDVDTIVKKSKDIINRIKLTYEEKLLLIPFPLLKFQRLRLRVILEQDRKCNCCSLSTWMGRDITFELNHIDGDNSNNIRENLEALCPNCHSQTDTWRGRNVKNIGSPNKKVTDQHLLEALLIHNWNMRQALLYVDLVPKGGNYKRCHFLKREYFNIFPD